MKPFLGLPEPVLSLSNPEHVECLRTPYKRVGEFLGHAFPLDWEHRQLDSMRAVMQKKYLFFESREDSRHKKEVLALLSEIVKTWSYQVALKEKQPEMVASKIQAKLFTFGSYYLNVDTSDGDIDMVCVVPKLFKKEEHFFKDLYEMLRNNSKTKYIQQVTGAKVPILKMEFDQIQIDISFAQLDAQTIDDDLDLTNNNVLINMDENSCRSLNGRRVADRILQAVPDQQAFRQTLRMVKLWAKNKGIYSNVMGYLGGVSWAIMAAKVCQLFPSLTPYRLFKMFFEVYSQWDWPAMPVKLYEIEDLPDNPKNPENWQGTPEDLQKGKMFVITPSFPCMNSSHMITDSSLVILKDLLLQARHSLFSYEAAPPALSTQQDAFWDGFFARLDFFNIYPNFIQIDILAHEQEDFKLWQGHVESKIRRLYLYFEKQYELNPPLVELFDFHLFPQAFSKTDKQFPFCKTYFYGIRLKASQVQNNQKSYADFKLPVSFFVKSLIEDKYFCRKKATQNLRVFQVKRQQFKISNNEVIAVLPQAVQSVPLLPPKAPSPIHDFTPLQDFDQPLKKVKQEEEALPEKTEPSKRLSFDSDESYLDKFQN